MLYKVFPLDTINQSFIARKLDDSVYDTFKQFLKTKECDDVDWSLLFYWTQCLRDELWDSASQLRPHIYDLEASCCTLRKNLISYRCRVEIAENKTQDLILLLAELQCKLNTSLIRCLLFK